MSTITIRPGAPEDVLACTAVWRATIDVGLPPPTVGYHLYHHELDTGSLVVAERGGEICGFGGSITRGDRWFVADLFVAPEIHGERLGRRLLEALVDTDRPGPTRATMGSTDPRALTLYSQHGMSPRWPCFWLTAPAGRIAPVGRPVGDVEPCATADLVEFAADCGYPLDRVDVDYWCATADAVSVVVHAAGRPIGAGVVKWSTPFSVADPTAISLGPVFACSPGDVVPTIGALVEYAGHRAGGRTVACYVPGPNPALAPLLHAGFRIDEFDVYCTSDETVLDPHTVLPSHDLL